MNVAVETFDYYECGFHIYTDIWEVAIGDELECGQELGLTAVWISTHWWYIIYILEDSGCLLFTEKVTSRVEMSHSIGTWFNKLF